MIFFEIFFHSPFWYALKEVLKKKKFSQAESPAVKFSSGGTVKKDPEI